MCTLDMLTMPTFAIGHSLRKFIDAEANFRNFSVLLQEFMILPVGAKSFTEAMQMATETYHKLKGIIKKKYGQDACNVGDEGGFAPAISSNTEGLDLVNQAIAVSLTPTMTWVPMGCHRLRVMAQESWCSSQA